MAVESFLLCGPRSDGRADHPFGNCGRKLVNLGLEFCGVGLGVFKRKEREVCAEGAKSF